MPARLLQKLRETPRWCGQLIQLYHWSQMFSLPPAAGGLYAQPMRTIQGFTVIRDELQRHVEFQRATEDALRQARAAMEAGR